MPALTAAMERWTIMARPTYPISGRPATLSASRRPRQPACNRLAVRSATCFSRTASRAFTPSPKSVWWARTEESLQRVGVDYVIGRGSYGACARGRVIGDSDGFLKLIFRRPDMKLLGVHAIGEQATELVHVGLIALLAGSSVDEFEEACFNIPTLGMLYKTAAMDAVVAISRV